MTQKPATASTRTSRSARSIALRLAAVALVLSLLFVTLIGPPAPSEITIYTGPEGSMFSEGGPDYAEALARNGIEARLVETQGSLENLDSLVHGEGPRVGFAEAALIRSYQTTFADSVSAEKRAEAEPGPGMAEGEFGDSSVGGCRPRSRARGGGPRAGEPGLALPGAVLDLRARRTRRRG